MAVARQRPTHRMRHRAVASEMRLHSCARILRVAFRAAAAFGLTGCVSADATAPAAPGPKPPAADGANLRLASVQFTQGAQDTDGSIPMISGTAMVANVLVERSRESVVQVPVVLRLYRAGILIRTDTARTGGVLSAATNPASPSAQFLVPANVVTDSLSWQVELDPARSVADSVRTDNLLPATSPAPLATVQLPSLDVRFVPIVLSQNEGVTGNVSAVNAEQYLAGVRAMLPTGRLTVSVGTPLTSQSNFGTAPDGGAPSFWGSVLQDVDLARLMSSNPQSVWYGIVPLPPGFSKVKNGGYAFIPDDPTSNGYGTHAAASLELTSSFGVSYAREVVAHELAHTFGRNHAPGCGAGAPIDTAFPWPLGAIGVAGHDVWNWAGGLTVAALSRAATTGDVMSYCTPVWTSPYTWRGVLRWRQAAGGVVTRTSRTRATLVAGSIAADGSVTLHPALDAEVTLPTPTVNADVRVEVRDGAGAVVARQQVAAVNVDHGGGMRQFLAVFPAVGGAAAQIVATTRAGATARITARGTTDRVSARVRPSGASEITSSAGNALLVRDATTGEMLGIGWNGRVVIQRSGGFTVTVSDGVRSRRAM